MFRTILLYSLVLATSGCFIPIPFNEPGSPLVVGQYRQRDGMPAAGARVAVTHDPYDATTCNDARVLAVTDSAGTFRLPTTTVRRRGLLLIPPIERFWNSYGLCLSTTDSLLHLAGVGAVMLGGRDRAKTDSLACREWVWQDEGTSPAGPRGTPRRCRRVGVGWRHGRSRSTRPRSDSRAEARRGCMCIAPAGHDTGGAGVRPASASLSCWARPETCGQCRAAQATGRPADAAPHQRGTPLTRHSRMSV